MPLLLDVLDQITDNDNGSSDSDSSSTPKQQSSQTTSLTPASSVGEPTYSSGVVPRNRFPTPVVASSRTYIRVNGRDVRQDIKTKTPNTFSKEKTIRSTGTKVRSTSSALVGKNATHKWAAEEKRALLILFAYYDLTWTLLAQVMNAFFSSKRQAPFRDHMISSMYSELRRQKTAVNAEIWTSVAIEIWQESDEHKSLLRSVERVARVESLSLQRRAKADLERRGENLARRKHKVDVRVQNRYNLEPTRKDHAASTTAAPKEQHSMNLRSRQQSPASKLAGCPSKSVIHDKGRGKAPPAAASEKKNSAKRPVISSAPQTEHAIPRLLFRTFNNLSSGLNTSTVIRAGHYACNKLAQRLPIDPAPNSLDNFYFLDDCFQHLHRVSGNTHIISTTCSLLWSLHRLLQQGLSDENASLVVINGPGADAATKVFAVKPIIKKLRERKSWAPVRYHGSYEFFVWGKVAGEEIEGFLTYKDLNNWACNRVAVRRFLQLDIIRSSTKISSLRQIFAAERKVLDLQTALAMGEIANRLGITPGSDFDSVSTIIYGLLQGWVVRLSPTFSDEPEQAQLVFEAFVASFSYGLDHAAKQALPERMEGLMRAWSSAVSKANGEIEKQFGRLRV